MNDFIMSYAFPNGDIPLSVNLLGELALIPFKNTF